MAMDRITRLRIFTQLAHMLSFTKAAATLDIARSSVTKAVNELEAELGTRLFDRTTRSVSLTLDGNAFLERCETVLREFDEAGSMFVSDDARPSGRVRASVPSRIGRRLIAPALPEFLAQYPDIKLDLNVSDRQADLIREGFDCVLRVGEKTDSELVSRKLADLQLISCASRAYLERHGTPRVAQDLASHTAVGYASPFTGRVSEWSFEVNGESDGVTLATRVNASDAEMYIACCEAGLGIIQVPRFDVRDSLAAGILVEVLPDISAGTMPIAIVYAHRRNLTPRVKVFVDWLSALIAEAASG